MSDRPDDRGTVTLLCFPPYDKVFAYVAQTRLEALSDPDPASLQADLRRTHPDAVVRAREPLASLGHGPTWYVYRDGRYSPFGDEAPWWDDPETPRLEIDRDGRYIGANDAALRLIGTDLETLRTLRSGDLTDEATRPTVAWFWRLLDGAGELHSTSMLVTPSGRRVPVEYRTVQEPDRAVSYLRVVPRDAVDRSQERTDQATTDADGAIEGSPGRSTR